MELNIIYDEVKSEEIALVANLIIDSFDKYVGVGYSEEGKATFKNFVKPEKILERISCGTDYVLIAKNNEKIVGVIDIRNCEHISLLFVDEDYHKKGIAKGLYKRVLEKLEVKKKGISEITVNSSPYAIEVYGRLGFIKKDEEQEKDGIRFIPMVASLG